MKRSASIEALIIEAKKDSVSIEEAYKKSLTAQNISEKLKVDIKNVFENLRSCLDYLANEIFEKAFPDELARNLYFPIRQTKAEFEKVIADKFPNLSTSNPAIYSILEKVQPYNDPWLGKFNKLNNQNKHQELVEQTRREQKQVIVSHPSGGGVSWEPGVEFGSGVSVMGVPIDPSTQLPVPNNVVKTEVVTWVDFKFKITDDSVLPFIGDSIKHIEKLFDELKKEI